MLSMNDMTIRIAGPSDSSKASLFNLFSRRKKNQKSTIGPGFYKK
jgi:hypothetical protein